MAVQVETYEVEEIPGGTTPEIETEAAALIEKLGLKGQTELLAPKGERVQFPEMTAQEHAVYGELFPQRTPVADYAAALIPLRVLQLIAYATEQEQFTSIEVWHKRVRDPDPILVGKRKGDKVFLMARWGDALQPFARLAEEARAHATVRIRGVLQKVSAELQGHLAPGGAEALAQRLIAGERWMNVAGAYL